MTNTIAGPMDDDELERFTREAPTMPHEHVIERVADMMAASVCAGNVPREVMLRALRQMPKADLIAVLEQAGREARALQDAAASRGCVATIGYNSEELARVQAEQRKLK